MVGSLSTSVRGVSGHVACVRLSFCFSICHCLISVFCSFTFQSVLTACLPCSHFLPVLMAKDSSCTKSRAAKQFETYNKSPKSSSTERSGDDRGGLSRSNHGSSSSSCISSEPLDWVMKLPKKQQANTTEMKREIVASSECSETHTADPEFHFTGNKKQYYLNKEVLEKMTRHW